MLKRGDRVRISGAAGVDVGEVLDVTTPAKLPDLPELAAGPAREVLEEWGVEYMAAIAHQLDRPVRLMFVALKISGRWFDLHGGEIEISPAPDVRRN